MSNTRKNKSVFNALLYPNLISFGIIICIMGTMYLYSKEQYDRSIKTIAFAHGLGDYTLEMFTSLKQNINTNNPLHRNDFDVLKEQTEKEFKKIKLYINTKWKKNKIAKEVIVSIDSYLKVINSIDPDKISEKELNEIENSFFQFINYSNYFTKYAEDLSEKLLWFNLSIMLFLILINYLVTRTLAKKVAVPLERLQELSKNFSLTKKEANILLDSDIEEIVSLEKNLVEMTSRIQEQNQEISKQKTNHIIANIAEGLAHTINNPLAIIELSSTVIKRKSEQLSKEQVQKQAQTIIDNVKIIGSTTKRMIQLITDVKQNELKTFKFEKCLVFIQTMVINKLLANNISLKTKESDTNISLKWVEVDLNSLNFVIFRILIRLFRKCILDGEKEIFFYIQKSLTTTTINFVTNRILPFPWNESTNQIHQEDIHELESSVEKLEKLGGALQFFINDQEGLTIQLSFPNLDASDDNEVANDVGDISKNVH